MMPYEVLLKSSSDEVVSIISRRRCISLYLRGKVELVDFEEGSMHPRLTIGTDSNCIPNVARFFPGSERVPAYQRMAPTKWNIATRDRFTCQYTGRRVDRKSMSIDHVIPKSRWQEARDNIKEIEHMLWPEITSAIKSGEDPFCWENLVLTSSSVNFCKDNMMPWECGMYPINTPRKICIRDVALIYIKSNWKKHLEVTDVNTARC
jgi:5-methylcytosine-specific restriction endonuclease McrA